MKTRGFEKISYQQWISDLGEDKEELYKKFSLPTRATVKSAGYDVFSLTSFTLQPGESILLPTGFKSYMLEDEKLSFYPRSGLGFKYFLRLANTVGIGDSDYYNNPKNEGHYWLKLRNEGDKVVEIGDGVAVCQCIFEKYLLADGDDVSALRMGGFGSTDKK